MDPRQFVKNSNVQVQRSDTIPSVSNNTRGNVPMFNELRLGKFRPGMYNALINKLFKPETNGDKRVDIKYILKQKPKGHASISGGITIDVNEIKGIYGRFQHWKDDRTRDPR